VKALDIYSINNRQQTIRYDMSQLDTTYSLPVLKQTCLWFGTVTQKIF